MQCFLRGGKTLFRSIVCAVIAAVVLAGLLSSADAKTKGPKQMTFASPDEAAAALAEAVRSNDTKAQLSVLGPGATRVLSSGDDVADRALREWFVKTFEESHRIEQESPDKAVLIAGKEEWPLPIPIVRKGDRWLFDTKAGREEIINRRIGRNELHVIEFMQAYVDAQREYIGKDWDGDGVRAYAQKVRSTPGRKNGLYWEAMDGEPESPFGPLVAQAAAEGYDGKAKSGKPSPFRGYYFRILKGQGKHAPGGAYDYVVRGNMILGFAIVGYPAKYGSSGIMTFIVNQGGVVHQKDLGGNTTKTARSMKLYDPDATWKRVEEPAEQK